MGTICGIKLWDFFFVFTLRYVLVPTVDGAGADCGRIDDVPQYVFYISIFGIHDVIINNKTQSMNHHIYINYNSDTTALNLPLCVRGIVSTYSICT